MNRLLEKLHTRLGDLWWYSLMIFVACRSGDVIQAFIGLWLVPKYVGSKELGAVLPLQQLSGLFAVPLAILATVFAKYVNTYATRGEYGKVKGLIRDVLLTAIGVFLICIGVAYLIIPHFYERLNIQAGLLTVLILAAGFAGNIANLFTSALQGLKKFKTMTVQNLISAPIRLVTLLVAMPFRALSGYILGQTTPPATCSLLAAWSLQKDLKEVPFDTSWRKDIPEIWRYLVPVAIYMGFAAVFGAVQSTIYRQRLPEIESAAYYLLTRFTEIAGYVGLTLISVLQPIASEAHEKGKEDKKILRQVTFGTILSTVSWAVILHFIGADILSLTSTWAPYKAYAGLFPALVLIIGLSTLVNAFVAYEMACRRFKSAIYIIIVSFFWTAFIVCATGYTYFDGILPATIVTALGDLNLRTLKNMTIAHGVLIALQLIAFRLAVPLKRMPAEHHTFSHRES